MNLSDIFVTIFVTIFAGIIVHCIITWWRRPYKVTKRRTTGIKNIKPADIMGDRGKEENGFQASKYLSRNIDCKISQLIPTCNLVVVTGAFTSGKSRAVYEYIKSEECPPPFNRVYLAHEHKDKCKEDIQYLSPDTLIVLDDINTLWNPDSNDLKDILSGIHNRNLHAIATISETTEQYDDLISLCQPASDDYRGKQTQAEIPILKIPAIEPEDDDVYDWCSANLHPEGITRTMGGYIPGLQRYFEQNNSSLRSDQNALAAFAAYVILAKFRREKSKTRGNVQKMYAQMISRLQPEKTGQNLADDFMKGLNKACKLGFLSLRDDTIAVADNSLYEKFRADCVKHKQNQPIIEHYLLPNATAEMNQVEALIGIDPDDPEYYGRAITKAAHSHQTIPKVEQKLIDRFFERNADGKLQVLQPEDPGRMERLVITISCIVGRSGMKYEQTLEKYLDAGIKPTIMTVGELLRIASSLRNSQLRDNVLAYAETIRTTYQLRPDIYYYRRCEEIDSDRYDINRIAKVCEIYHSGNCDLTTEEGRYNVDNFRYYANILTSKALSVDLMDEYFLDILPAYPELPITKTALRQQQTALCRNHSNTLDELLLHLVQHLGKINAPKQLKREDMRSTCILAITNCHTFSGAKRVYEQVIDLDKKDEKYVNILTIELFKKIRTTDDFNQCLEVLKERIDSMTRIQYAGASLKLFNVLLFNAPGNDSIDGFQQAWELIDNNALGLNDRDIFSVNNLLTVALRCLRNTKTGSAKQIACKQLTERVEKIEEYRQQYSIHPNANYLSSLYKMCTELESQNYDNNPVRAVVAGIKGGIPMTPVLQAQEIDVELERFKDLVNQYFTRILQDGAYVNSDVITHLLKRAATCTEETVQQRVAEIAAGYDKKNVVNIHFYCQLLRFDLCRGKYHDHGQLQIDRIKDYIRSAFRQLTDYQQKLYENRSDLICTAIRSNDINYDEAYELALFAATELLEQEWTYDRALRPAAIALLCRKLRNAQNNYTEDEIRDRVKNIQEKLIDPFPKARFTEDDRRIISASLRKLKTDNLFINYPLTRQDRRLRHANWDMLYAEDTLADAFDNDLLTFAKMEIYNTLYHIMRSTQADNKILAENMEYLIAALDELKNRKAQVRKFAFVNRDGYLNNKHRPSSWRHPDFFNAFAQEGYVAAKDKEHWQGLAGFHGYPLSDLYRGSSPT